MVGNHLTEKGVFVQWMGLRFVDESLMRSLLGTVHDVFRNVALYSPIQGSVLVVAGNGDIGIADHAEGMIAACPTFFNRRGVYSGSDLAASLLLEAEGSRVVSRRAERITDNRNLLAMRCPRIMRKGLGLAGKPLALGSDPLLPADEPWNHIEVVRRLLAFGTFGNGGEFAGVFGKERHHLRSLGEVGFS